MSIQINHYHPLGKFNRWQADDIFLFLPENRLWPFMQTVSEVFLKSQNLFLYMKKNIYYETSDAVIFIQQA